MNSADQNMAATDNNENKMMDTAMLHESADLDLSNLLENLPLTVLVFDTQFALMRMTASVRELTPSIEAGASLQDVAVRVGDGSLIDALHRAADANNPPEPPATVELTEGKRCIRRISAYKNGSAEVIGTIVTYIDVEIARPDAVLRRKASQRAHDLRTPLSVILMWAKLLRSRPMGPTEQSAGLDAIIRSAEQQQSLIEQHAREG